MANPRQRSKAKSSRSTKPSLAQKKRMHAKLRKTPALRGPEALQKAWDKKKTVFQNYAALGLLPSIPVAKRATTSRSQRVRLPQVDDEEAPKVGFGRIIRDDEGNVIDIIIDGEDEEEKMDVVDEDKWTPLNDEEVEGKVVQAKTDVVRELETIAASAAPVQRHTSSAEKIWLARMVQKYGDDFATASRDRKLNVWQKTPGEIKRMVKKAGGVQVLQALKA